MTMSKCISDFSYYKNCCNSMRILSLHDLMVSFLVIFPFSFCLGASIYKCADCLEPMTMCNTVIYASISIRVRKSWRKTFEFCYFWNFISSIYRDRKWYSSKNWKVFINSHLFGRTKTFLYFFLYNGHESNDIKLFWFFVFFY